MPRRGWSRGSIVLLGDAAHATTPNMGQGGAQALEDALALADAFAAHGPGPRAFAEYEKARRAKATHVVRMSLFAGKLGHVRNPLLRRMRNVLMRRLPASIAMRQLDGIYTVKDIRR
jgi:2-polyprenyl-6-methoxyphenol hydroxylase-like FAD-dependent oxidoreductase